MFGLFFLVAVPLLVIFYIILVYRVSSKKSVWLKLGILGIGYGIPALYPFMYKFSALYNEYERLCSSSCGVKIYKTIKTDYFQPSCCFGDGYEALQKMPYVGFIYEGNVFVRGKYFDSNKCHDACRAHFSEKCKEMQCLSTLNDTSGIDLVIYKKEYAGHESSNLINSLLTTKIERLVSEKHGVIAESYNYTFYPYGDGWAKILGASSGNPPSIKCKKDVNFNYYEITPPIRSTLEERHQD